MDIPDDKKQAIHEAIAARRKIQAIKMYRGHGRRPEGRQGRDDALERELRASRPDLFLGRPAKTGCAASAIGILILVVAGVALVAGIAGV